jgi:hypothetical protein
MALRVPGANLSLLLLSACAGPLYAHPDAPPWGLDNEEQCAACHFSAPVVESSAALELEGLPKQIEPGHAYHLELHFEPERMRRAGFLLVAHAPSGSAGRLRAVDDRVETAGARARSTLAGTQLTAQASMRGRIDWQAPHELTGPIMFTVTANAANDDSSPLGDVIHRAEFQRP